MYLPPEIVKKIKFKHKLDGNIIKKEKNRINKEIRKEINEYKQEKWLNILKTSCNKNSNASKI